MEINTKHTYRLFLALGAFAVLLFGQACGTEEEGTDCATGQIECDGKCIAEIAPSLSAIQTEVFAKSCGFSTCHDASQPAEGLDLSSQAASQAALVGVKSVQNTDQDLVVPGSVATSYLADKLRGKNLGKDTDGVDSVQMPLGTPLCDAKISAVEAWISAGAN